MTFPGLTSASSSTASRGTHAHAPRRAPTTEGGRLEPPLRPRSWLRRGARARALPLGTLGALGTWLLAVLPLELAHAATTPSTHPPSLATRNAGHDYNVIHGSGAEARVVGSEPWPARRLQDIALALRCNCKQGYGGLDCGTVCPTGRSGLHCDRASPHPARIASS